MRTLISLILLGLLIVVAGGLLTLGGQLLPHVQTWCASLTMPKLNQHTISLGIVGAAILVIVLDKLSESEN